MKNFALPLFLVALAVSSCNNSTATIKEQNGDEHSVPAKEDSASVATLYRCPMKCEGSEGEKPGKCPVCKMDLMAVEGEPGKQ